MVNVRLVKEISNEKVMEPDTIEELIEAMKILDKSKAFNALKIMMSDPKNIIYSKITH